MSSLLLGWIIFLKKKNIQNVKSASLHPGIVSTGFGTDSLAVKFLRCCCCCMVVESQGGATRTLHVCRIPYEEVKSGEYYDDDSSHKEMDKNNGIMYQFDCEKK